MLESFQENLSPCPSLNIQHHSVATIGLHKQGDSITIDQRHRRRIQHAMLCYTISEKNN